ncbi:MAG: Stp1/IreP family PP2C-type Ser/Thr phosphatase [Bacteroidia bacterium]|nr:Stp1/IreP family PP2C-type Ser/Thr phosphatase [Bacteroidia bacterium]MCX7764242.1 Stp1/IreP family PP2C-type Ser/Thr phosphatase [Bacteroidia bacterium]MDW8057429.1 Stp1/IreP family PP2C-type Ser/Thr phosphatase [Bacteroidia bacterium]
MFIGYKAEARSDKGRVRPNNEDKVAHFRTDIGTVWMVCDGMGGHAAGEKASELAVKAVFDFFRQPPSLPYPQLLEKALHYANDAIYTVAQANPQYRKMGTTCVIALYKDGLVYYGHVGDSRLYYMRGGQLVQKTQDHSYVQFLISQGLLTPEEAAFHPRRHVILRALGISPRPEPEIAPEPLQIQPGDMLLLCSDGLTNMLSDKEIETILNLRLPLRQRVTALIDAANDAGGHDNISVIIVEFEALS